jgi:hypothetical protein
VRRIGRLARRKHLHKRRGRVGFAPSGVERVDRSTRRGWDGDRRRDTTTHGREMRIELNNGGGTRAQCELLLDLGEMAMFH